MTTTLDLHDDDHAFLRDLVKTSRQRPHMVPWIDRDGTGRHTVLNPVEVGRVNALARRLGIAKAELLRRAAHIPVAKYTAPAPTT